MKKTHKAILVLGLTTLLAGVTAVQANEPPRDFKCRAGQGAQDCDQQRMDRFAQRLDLTDAQRKQVQGIFDQYKPEREQLQNLLRENRQEIDRLSAADPKLAVAADKQGKAFGQMIVLRKKIEAAVDAVLTPAQREKLQQMKQHRLAGHERWQEHSQSGLPG